MLDPSRIEVPGDDVVELLRRLTPAERLAIANRMWVSARNALLTMLRTDHPEWNEQQVQQEVARRMRGVV
jgi:Rv0078B-related antitoxin